jgi:hypothetical protein
MPYGTIRPETREHILLRAHQSNINVDEWVFETRQAGAFEYSVIYGGALDESFEAYVGNYEVTVADWIAELLRAESEADADHSDWSVLVHQLDSPDTHYRITSEDSI